MRVKAITVYNFLFIIVIGAQLYLPSFKANVAIQLGVLSILVFSERVVISKGFLKVIGPLIGIFFLGFIGTLFNETQLVDVIKDVSYFLKPILGLLVSYLIYRKINDLRLFCISIISAGVISAFIHFALILFLSNTDTIAGIREFGKDNYLELFALLFLIYYKRFTHQRLFENKWKHRLLLSILLLSSILYFSRTMIVLAAIAILSIHGYTLITKNTMRLLTVMGIAIVGLYIYLFSINIDRNSKGIENFFYKIKIAPAELFKSNIDRENHSALWDHWRGYEAKMAFNRMNDSPESYIFGCGHGSLVNLRFRAPLTVGPEGIRYISVLHNGYVYILYKTGLVGIILFFIFSFQLYKRITFAHSFSNQFTSAIGIIFLFTTLTITGIYNVRDIIILLLGALLFFNNQKQEERLQND